MCDASRKFCAWAVTRYGKSRLSALSKYVVGLVFAFCARSGSLLHHLRSIFNAFNCPMLPKWSRWGGTTWYVLLRLLTLLCLTPLDRVHALTLSLCKTLAGQGYISSLWLCIIDGQPYLQNMVRTFDLTLDTVTYHGCAQRANQIHSLDVARCPLAYGHTPSGQP